MGRKRVWYPKSITAAGRDVIHLFTSGGRNSGKTARFEAAIAERLRAGEDLIEVSLKRGVQRLELDGFGGIRRVPLGRRAA